MKVQDAVVLVIQYSMPEADPTSKEHFLIGSRGYEQDLARGKAEMCG